MQKLQSLKPKRTKRGEHFLITSMVFYDFQGWSTLNMSLHKVSQLVSLWEICCVLILSQLFLREACKVTNQRSMNGFFAFAINMQISFCTQEQVLTKMGVNHHQCPKHPYTWRLWKMESALNKNGVITHKKKPHVNMCTDCFKMLFLLNNNYTISSRFLSTS